MAVAFFAATYIGVPSAHATTMIRASLPQLVDGADIIGIFRAEEKESFWQGQRVYTRTQLHPQAIWHSQHTLAPTEAAQLSIMVLGGVAATPNGLLLGQNVPGSPKLETGKDYVMFLKKGKKGSYWPVALGQGLFAIQESTSVLPDATAPGLQVVQLSDDINFQHTGRPQTSEPPANGLNVPSELHELRLRCIEAVSNSSVWQK